MKNLIGFFKCLFESHDWKRIEPTSENTVAYYTCDRCLCSTSVNKFKNKD